MEALYAAVQCMNTMFGYHASKFLPVDRVAAFAKRLVNISTHLSPEYAIAAMHQARRLMLSDPRLYNMLSFEGGNDRKFHAEESNPDHGNALSCCLWELALYAEYWHKFENYYSRDLVLWSEIPPKLSTLTPNEILNKVSVTKTGNFMPRVEVNKRASHENWKGLI